MAWLTKSRFLAGLQCPKRLWFEINQPLTEPVAATMPMLNGRMFDHIVQRLAPGMIISRASGMPAAIAETRRVLQAGASAVLYQPAFRHGNLAVIADVLRRQETGFQLVEVKASAQVKAEHVPDAAFQTLVLRGAKLPVTGVHIGHVNNAFVLERADDYSGLMIEADVTAAVEAQLPDVAEQAARFLGVMAAREVPAVPMGPQCTAPHQCPFIERCVREAGEPLEYPVEILPRGARVAAALRAAGYGDLRQVPAQLLEQDAHRRVHAVTVSGVACLDPAAAQRLNALPFPKAYLDFETISFAVPQLIGTRPYQQWPFQFSLHIEEAGAAVRHVEFLEPEAFGDFARIAAALVSAVPESGPVFVYNASLEAGVIERLAERLPAYRLRLHALLERLVDLLPITRDSYYHPAMKGSWSIKAVLPTIDPALGYQSLGGIAAGDAAQRAFMELREPATAPERRSMLMAGLRSYCERDTWGMVVLARFLGTDRRVSCSKRYANI